MTVDTGQKSLTDSQEFRREVLDRLQILTNAVRAVQREEEEKRKQHESTWNAVKRVVMAIVYEKGWAVKPGKEN